MRNIIPYHGWSVFLLFGWIFLSGCTEQEGEQSKAPLLALGEFITCMEAVSEEQRLAARFDIESDSTDWWVKKGVV